MRRLTALLPLVVALGSLTWASAAPASAASPASEVEPLADIGAIHHTGVVFHGLLYFGGETTAAGQGLWSTDGTAAGTHLVARPDAGAISGVSDLAVVNDHLVFLADDGVHGTEPWTSDGTSAGTHLLDDIDPGKDGSDISDPFTVVDGLAYFGATDPDHGYELWSTDGRTSTRLVTELRAGPKDGLLSSPVPLGDRIVFVGIDDAATARAFVLMANTTEAQEVAPMPGAPPTKPGSLSRVGSAVYFSAADPNHGTELWETRGEPGDAQRVADISPGAGDSGPAGMTALGDRVLFRATTPEAGYELWTSDGTASGTSRIADLAPGVGSSVPVDLTAVDGQLYFTADDGTHGRELWTTQGDPSSTHLVADLAPGPHVGTGASPGDGVLHLDDAQVVAGRLLFDGFDGTSDHAYATEGAGVRQLDGVPAGQVWGVGVLGNTAVFSQAGRLYAWTATGSTTTVHAKHHYSARKALKKKLKVRVTVTTGLGTPATGGTVTLTKHGRTIGTAPVVGGTATVHIATRLRPGRKRTKKYAVQATWSGSVDATASASSIVKLRIARPRHHRKRGHS
jgi:ELWxxDGT repeat protein